MKPGQVTQPIRVAKGYQILKLETLKDSVGAAVRRACATWSPSGSTPTASGRKCASSSPACAARRSSSGRTPS